MSMKVWRRRSAEISTASDVEHPITPAALPRLSLFLRPLRPAARPAAATQPRAQASYIRLPQRPCGAAASEGGAAGARSGARRRWKLVPTRRQY
mmetsp:Transcript_22149/g.77633  ORF Transcript_22149/g.77633 Transcript_22149/m.77633 type:complete len:94 (-) Transcript_22149:372-653(-)